jgi:hypothetical protein
MQQVSSQEQVTARASATRPVPQERYAYYRRCQVFRKGGEQCKAPAEKGSLICHAHAGQLAMAVRRERERRAVLAEAVAEMRRRGNGEFEAKDLFTSFKGIQVTLAVTARALINGKVDCKTAGRLVVQLQTFSKLLRMVNRKVTPTTEARRHREKPELPQIYADERRLSKENVSTGRVSTTKDSRSIPVSQAQGHSGQATEHKGSPAVKTGNNWAANQRERTRIAVNPEVLVLRDNRDWAHAPPEWARAA